ncbi:MAG: hypothetical protein ABUS79_09790 [Pseudomonadota bacterium]
MKTAPHPDRRTRRAHPRRRTFLLWVAAATPALPCSWLGFHAPVIAGAARVAAAATAAATLAIQPFGRVTDTELDFIERALAAFFDFRVQRLPARPLPVEAYHAARRRHRADKILDALGRQPNARAFDRVVGVTAGDISTTKGPYPDWGVMGLGIIGGRACVVSSFRCKRRAPTPAVATVRLAKMTIHEIGHTLGLQHCPTLGCLMEDAAGSVLTSDRDTDLCADCRARSAAHGFTVKRTPSFHWTLT